MSNETPNQRLGGFELLEKIGEGGMGVVHRAKQTSLERIVAIKILTPRLTSESKYVNSFLREARAAARLNHPNIISVFDAGEADGLYYYAMEFVDGQTLAQWVKQNGALAEESVLSLAVAVAGALNHAWTQEQIIHRDIKPENIMIDSQGAVKLCDLGLAKSFGENTTLSLSGSVFGTPQYMSPEQARAEHVDFRTDIYALGMTLYFALTGNIPFHGGSPALVMARQLHEQLDDPRDTIPTISEHTCRVLEKMLAKKADDRYQSWDEVLRDLQLAQSGQPPQCQPPPVGASSLKVNGRMEAMEGRAQPVLSREASRPMPHPSPQDGRDGARPSKKSLAPYVAIAAVVFVSVAVGSFFFFKKRDEQTPAPPVIANQDPKTQNLKPSDPPPPVQPDDPAARRAQEVFDAFARDFKKAVTLRNYEIAQDAAHRAATDPNIGAFKQSALAADAIAKRAAQLWQSLPADLAKQRGKYLKIADNHYLFVVGVDGQNLIARPTRQPRPEMTQQVTLPLDRFDPPSMFATAAAVHEQSDPATRAAIAWICFSEDDLPVALTALDRAEAAGANVEPDRQLITLLAAATMEETANRALQHMRRLIAEQQWAQARERFDIMRRWFRYTRVFQAAHGELVRMEAVLTEAGAAALPSGGAEATKRLLELETFIKNNPQAFNDIAERARKFIADFPNTAEAARMQEFLDGISGLLNAARVPADAAALKLDAHKGGVAAVAFSPDGKYVLTGGMDKTAKLWDTATGELVRTLEGHTAGVIQVGFTADGKKIFTTDNDKLAIVWEAATGEKIASNREPESVRWMGVGFSAIVSPDARYALSVNLDSATKGFSGFGTWGVGRDGNVFLAGRQVDTSKVETVIKLWDVASGREIRQFLGHKGVVNGLAFSPDMRFVATSGEDKTVRLWEVASGREVWSYRASDDALGWVAFSPDGKLFASSGRTGMVRLHDAATGRELRLLRGHAGFIHEIIFSPDGRHLVTASADKQMLLWEVATGKLLKVFEHPAAVNPVAFSPDGQSVATGSYDGFARVWNIWEDKPIAKPPPVIASPIPPDPNPQNPEPKTDPPPSADLAEAEKLFAELQQSLLAAWSKRDYTAADRLAQDALENPALDPLQNRVTPLASVAARLQKFWDGFPATLAPLKGRQLTLAGDTGALSEFNRDELVLEKKIGDSGAVAFEIPLSKLTTQEVASLTVAARPNDGDALLSLAWFSFADGKPDWTATFFDAAQKQGKNTAPDRELLTAFTKGAQEVEAEKVLAQVRDAASRNQLADADRLLTFLKQRYPTARVVTAAATELRELEEKISGNEGVSRLPAGAMVQMFVGHTAEVGGVAFSPDGKHLASSSGDGTIRLWQTATGREIRSFDGTRYYPGVMFSPDGRFLLGIVNRDRGRVSAAKLWEVGSGKEVSSFSVQHGEVMAAAMSPDGRLVATGDSEKQIILWEAATGRELRKLIGHGLEIRALAFSPDGRLLLSASADKTARVWDVATGKELRSFLGHTASVNRLSISPDGKRVATASRVELKVWDIATVAELQSGAVEKNYNCNALAFTPDGRSLLGAFGNNPVILDAKSGDISLRLQDTSTRSVAYSADGKWIATGNASGIVRVWKVEGASPDAARTPESRVLRFQRFLGQQPNFANKPVLLLFIQAQTNPSTSDIQRLRNAHQNLEQQGVAVIGVFNQPDDLVATFCRAHTLEFPVAIDNRLARVYQLVESHLPFGVLVDRNGNALWRGTFRSGDPLKEITNVLGKGK